jgi:hypothetical protein
MGNTFFFKWQDCLAARAALKTQTARFNPNTSGYDMSIFMNKVG